KGDGSLDGSYKKPIFGASGRIGFWKEGLGMLSTNPVFGIGLNTYTELAKIQKFPHNSFLRLLVEIGVVGFTAFLYLLGAIFFKGFWRLFRMDDVQLKYIGIGVFSGLIGFLAQSFVDTNFYSIQLATLMWYFMGVLIAIFQISEGNSAITSN
ncbi:MAG: putative inorganic carbon (HCO3(-)) transporter, partial [Candidatus Omnitrophota bacterium]